MTAFAARRERAQHADATERLGVLAHELRNQLNIATLSFELLKSGRVALGGSTGVMHARSLPPGKADELFQPYSQNGADRSGLGLGLAICRRAAVATAGSLAVRDLPGKGCVFTLELPIA